MSKYDREQMYEAHRRARREREIRMLRSRHEPDTWGGPVLKFAIAAAAIALFLAVMGIVGWIEGMQ